MANTKCHVFGQRTNYLATKSYAQRRQRYVWISDYPPVVLEELGTVLVPYVYGVGGKPAGTRCSRTGTDVDPRVAV
eukprot:scaffold606323_cov23-Prasinocladus_malaysianus.AAC.1